MLVGILTFLQCLPQLLALMDRMGKLMNDHNISEWMTSLEASIDQLEKAKTSDDKIKAAQSVLTSIRSLQ